MIFEKKNEDKSRLTRDRVSDLENQVKILTEQNTDLQTQLTGVLKVIVNVLQQLEMISKTTVDGMTVAIETHETLNKLIVAHYDLVKYVMGHASAATKPLDFPPLDKPTKIGTN